MSALTKLFVVLLVVTSLLLTAATVVFVNRTDNYRKWAENAMEETRREQRRANVAELAQKASETREQDAKRDGEDRAKALLTDITKLKTDIGQRDQMINVLENEKLGLVASIQIKDRTVEALRADLGIAEKKTKDLMDENNKRMMERFDLNAAVADATKKIEALDKERRWLTEQLTQVKADYAQLLADAADRGVVPTRAAVARNRGVEVKGVIREARTLNNGLVYATISVGAADKVKKGMQFTVYDETGFMGILTVETVDQNSAFGRCEGPRVKQIKPDNQVQTQMTPAPVVGRN